jgi:hypothetical protein
MPGKFYYNKNNTRLNGEKAGKKLIVAYFFLCLFFLKRFLRLWVAILCLLRFLPLGIMIIF